MATLKICTHDRTQWLLGVRRIIEQNSFSIPEGEKPKNETVLQAALSKGGPPPHVVNLVDFSGELVGKVLQVTFGRDDVEYWIVPSNSCYLMSDAGKTIDRI